MRIGCMAVLALLLTTCGPASPSWSQAPRTTAAKSPVPPDPTLDEIDQIVRQRFYSEATLEKVQWGKSVANARQKLTNTRSLADHGTVFEELLASLHTSHTEYVPRTDPKYWELASIFEELFAASPNQCPNKEKTLPPIPVTWQDIGVVWKRAGAQWFVGGVLDGGPAQKAGLLSGDEVLQADGKPFHPVKSFEGRQDKSVELTFRRRKSEAPARLTVVPRTSKPHGSFQEALAKSARILDANGERIAYIRIWSWTGDAMHQELKRAIKKLNEQKPTGYILDIRDGWGGAAPDYVDIFQKEAPVLVSKNRAGDEFRIDSKIRVPAAVLINPGSRSGKETIAYAIKKHALATLVGEPTAGAMLPGSPFCLQNGDLLYVATSTNTVDGETLEGRGVPPDVAIPFDIRYAAGRDPQLDAAVHVLASRSGVKAR
ncbi:S41 family peptidase [Pendulispora rubella]|uniref:S41 family peptidase n=1 Tax=Pendulispora rubella TaxID=2741070 RepID=A0ABZ2L1R6_9BACT